MSKLPTNVIKTALRWCPALIIAIIIFWFSSMPGNEIKETYNRLDTIAQPAASQTASPSTSTVKPRVPVATITTYEVTPARALATATPTALPISDIVRSIPLLSTLDLLKAGHAIGYFWLGLTVLAALGLKSRWSPAQALAMCALYAASDEFHQSFVRGRSSSINDALIDILAALVGVALLSVLIKWRDSSGQINARR